MQVESAVSALANSSPSYPAHMKGSAQEAYRSPSSPYAYESPAENNDDKSSDLGEVVTDMLDYDAMGDGGLVSSETDDSDMAKQIAAAGEGESLIDSDDSNNEAQLEQEGVYMIQDAQHDQHSETDFGLQDFQSQDELDKPGSDKHDDFWSQFSPAPSDTGPDVISDELFKPQRGFASTPEPSFADFFGSSDEADAEISYSDAHDTSDQEQGTNTEDSTLSSAESSSTISDAEPLSMSLADGINRTQHQMSEDLETHSPVQDTGDLTLQNAVPLLVIEDLDGRLIYARAGDGEAVFGSDGEFEFAGESDEQSSDFDGLSSWHPAVPGHLRNGTDGPMSESDDINDEGETTDELPDDDMPYPRLLVGSIAPRGGRNARRAREIAARSRQSSPRTMSPAPVSSHIHNQSVKKPSGLSNELSAADDDNSDTSSDSVQLVENGNLTPSPKKNTQPLRTVSSTETSPVKPVMGQFIPAMSKSIHRAVIDGSHRAPSPFDTLHNMQRDRRRRRTQQQSKEQTFEQAVSAGPSAKKRKRRMSLPSSRDFDFYVVNRSDVLSSPEPMGEAKNGGAMDIGDVLDEGLLWHASEDDSSEGEGQVTERPTMSSRPRSLPNGHDRAFARWNRIPMGAFRHAQEHSANSTAGSLHESLSRHRASGNFGLGSSLSGRKGFCGTSASPSGASQRTTPFRRSISALQDPRDLSSPLDRTLSDLVAPTRGSQVRKRSPKDSLSGRGSGKLGDHAVVGGNFLVSPVLRPVKHRRHSISDLKIDSPGSLGVDSSIPPSITPAVEHRNRRAQRRAKRHRSAGNTHSENA